MILMTYLHIQEIQEKCEWRVNQPMGNSFDIKVRNDCTFNKYLNTGHPRIFTYEP